MLNKIKKSMLNLIPSYLDRCIKLLSGHIWNKIQPQPLQLEVAAFNSFNADIDYWMSRERTNRNAVSSLAYSAQLKLLPIELKLFKNLLLDCLFCCFNSAKEYVSYG